MKAERLELGRWDGGDVAAIPLIKKRPQNTDFSLKPRLLTHKVSQGHSSGSKSSCPPVPQQPLPSWSLQPPNHSQALG